jgi:hypothetical protein
MPEQGKTAKMLSSDDLIKLNKEIDNIFKNIEGIAKSYLEISYPEAPDPDAYIEKIQDQIEKYLHITQGNIPAHRQISKPTDIITNEPINKRIEKVDILLMKDLVKEIGINVQRIEKRVKSCETRGIVIDFETTNEFIKKAGPMVAEMRLKDSENKEILEMAQNFASINNRYSTAILDFENNCICMEKSVYEKLRPK